MSEPILITAAQLNWPLAEETLKERTTQYLDNGALGIASYLVHVHPIRERFSRGERTEELYRDIFEIPEPHE